MATVARSEKRRTQKEGRSWRPGPLPRQVGMDTRGWLGKVDRTFSNGKIAVLVRPVQTEWGIVEHVAIRNLKESDIPWADKQKIKNDLFGPERIAIEVFPRESEFVDGAMMYHLWVLPEGTDLPFNLCSDIPERSHRQ